MLVRMRQAYQTADIGVEVMSRESLASISNFSALNDLNVGQGNIGTTTPQQDQLFQNRNDVGQNEIVVYFVRSLVPPRMDAPAFQQENLALRLRKSAPDRHPAMRSATCSGSFIFPGRITARL